MCAKTAGRRALLRLARCSTTPPGGAGSGERLEAEGVAALFLGPSADLEYLTGVERPVPSFGQPLYAHGWVTGAFFRPGAEPVFVLPRMFAAFDLREQPEGEVVIVNETDDGLSVFERVARAAAGSGVARGRRPDLGRDDAQPRPDPRRRPPAHRLARS